MIKDKNCVNNYNPNEEVQEWEKRQYLKRTEMC